MDRIGSKGQLMAKIFFPSSFSRRTKNTISEGDFGKRTNGRSERAPPSMLVQICRQFTYLYSKEYHQG